ncbi:alanine--tRNA ligase-related protein, partial [bacterium]|nr:alanine--tRNA ligase-related protein [bacterium]
MTRMLFREDAYLREAKGIVTAITDEGGIVLDQTIFYPTSGGQPGDSGVISWDSGSMEIATAVKGVGEDVVLVPAEPVALPAVGQSVTQAITWDRRHR